jgi:hypothetical protein
VDLEGGVALPDLTPQRIEALLKVVEGRTRVHPEEGIADPFENEPLAAEADLDEERGWLLDLRTAGHIPKHWLGGRSPSQLLPLGARLALQGG